MTFIRKSSKEEVLSNLGLIKDGIPSNGAVLLFGKYPQRRFVTSSFKIVLSATNESDASIVYSPFVVFEYGGGAIGSQNFVGKDDI